MGESSKDPTNPSQLKRANRRTSDAAGPVLNPAIQLIPAIRRGQQGTREGTVQQTLPRQPEEPTEAAESAPLPSTTRATPAPNKKQDFRSGPNWVP